MSNFIKLRLILQEQRPAFHNFIAELGQQQLQNGDLDLLLRKAVEGRIPDFPSFCRALVSKGANVNFYDSKDHISNLMIACEKGNLQMVNALLLHKEINLLHSDNRQLTAGFYAIDNKSREDGDAILRQLLERQPALINKEAGNQTLLIAAIRKCKVEIVKYLLELGADPNWQVPDTGNTALHDAVKQLKLKVTKAVSQIIRLLLLHGGDSTKKNKQQKTVYDYAERALAEYQKIEQAAIQQMVMAQTRVELLLELNSDQQIESVLLEAEKLFAKYEGTDGQINKTCFLTEIEVLPSLSKEIVAFEIQCLAKYKQARNQIDAWVQKIDKIIAGDGLAVEVYGSFATGLWVESSNVNLLIVRRDFPYDFNAVSPKELLEKIFDSLKKANICREISFTRNVRMPSIAVQIGEASKTRNIHLTLLDRAHNGRAITRFIIEQQQNYPLLRPMFYVLKQLSCYYGLNEPKSGGIRTYALIIMLLSCIAKWSEPNPAKLLLDFLYYFGFYYDYHYQAKSDPNDLLEKESMVLQILDPLNASNNVGKHVKASSLQSMFRAAYITLHGDVGSYCLKTLFDSHLIMLT